MSNFSSCPEVRLFFSCHLQNETLAASFHPSHGGAHTWAPSLGCLRCFWISVSYIALLKGGCMMLIMFLVFRTEKNILGFFKNWFHLISAKGNLQVCIYAASLPRVCFLAFFFCGSLIFSPLHTLQPIDRWPAPLVLPCGLRDAASQASRLPGPLGETWSFP